MDKPRHVLNLLDFTRNEIESIINDSIELKSELKKQGSNKPLLERKTLAMLFQKTSTRTRLSFETGMTQLGGHAIFIDSTTTQINISDLSDEGKVISRYADMIMARMIRHSDLEALASSSEVPVINGLTEKYHPCQAITDIMTIQEHLGSLKDKHLVYFGIANNVSNSLSLVATRLGMRFTLCTPERHPPSLDEKLLEIVKSTKLYSEEQDPEVAITDADVVYTDTWVDMELFADPSFAKEKKRRLDTFTPYQVNMDLIGKSKALIMHDMPMHIGYEISRNAADSENSVIFDQAENRLHAQKGLMKFLLQD